MKNPWNVLAMFTIGVIILVLCLPDGTDNSVGAQEIETVLVELRIEEQTKCEAFAEKIALGSNRIRPNSSTGSYTLYTLVYGECLALLGG